MKDEIIKLLKADDELVDRCRIAIANGIADDLYDGRCMHILIMEQGLNIPCVATMSIDDLADLIEEELDLPCDNLLDEIEDWLSCWDTSASS